MKLKKLISAFILLAIVYCINEYNPYTDSSNADIEIVSQTFTTADSVPIFSTETIVVKVAFAELVKSFTISARNNRLWQDTTIPNASFKNEHAFTFSFFDTGSHDIVITTTPFDAQPKEKLIRLYCYSPLYQDTVYGFGPYGDSVIVHAAPVEDIDVEYFWQFDKTVKYSYREIDTFVIEQFTEPAKNGKLWVQDTSGNSSPAVSFYYSLQDLRPPRVYCANEDFILADTIIAGTNLFALKVKIEDQVVDGIDSVSINGEEFDYLTGDNIHIKLYDSMSLYEDQPLKATVYARDKNSNDTVKSFYLFYDTTNIQTNKVTISIFTVNQTGFTTTTKKLSVIGESISLLPTSYTMKFFLNGTYLTGCDTSLYYQGIWGCNLILLENNINVFTVYALGTANDTLGKLSVDIIHDNSISDTVGPIISRVYVDNSDYSKEMIVSNTTPGITVYAHDLVSGIQRVLINKTQAIPDNKYLGWQSKVQLAHGSNTLPLKLYDYAGNTTQDTLLVTFNRLPELVNSPSLPLYLKAGNSYTDTLQARDNDGDSLVLVQQTPVPDMTITADKTGITTRFFAVWEPKTADTGSVDFTFRLYDGLQYSKTYSWSYEIVKDSIIIDPISFLTTSDDLPEVLIADSTSLIDTLEVVPGTGVLPLIYYAQVFPKGNFILYNSYSPFVYWNPTIQDTGTSVIEFTVYDINGEFDKFTHTVTVVSINNSPCTLSVEDVSGKNLLSGTILTLPARSDTGKLLFTITDYDHPLLEEFTITKWISNTSTTFKTDSNWFYINVIPILNADPDTLRIKVQDQTPGSPGDSMAISIQHPKTINPDSIDNLYLWLKADDKDKLGINPPDNDVIFWESSHNQNMNMVNDDYPPRYDESPLPHVEFDRNQQEFLTDLFTPTNTSYTIIGVANLSNIANQNKYTLLGLNDYNTGFVFGAIGDLVTCIYFLGPFQSTVYNEGTLRIEEDSWHIFSYTVTRGSSLALQLGLDGKKEYPHLFNNISTVQSIDLGAHDDFDDNKIGCWNGDIAEVIVYNRALSIKELEEVEGYLSEKFGITLQK